MSKKKKRNRKHTQRPQGATVTRAVEVGALVPQDHGVREEAVGGLRSVTYQGITWEVDPANLNDIMLLEYADRGNVIPMIKALIPDDDKRVEVLMTAADEDGRVTAEAAGALMEEIAETVRSGN